MTLLDDRSERNLKGVHKDLDRVVRRAWELADGEFIVIEGLRTKERQAELVKKGASRTMNSRHITGHAVDVVATVTGDIRWDFPLYTKLSKHFKQAAAELKIPIVWGGDWRTFKDGPHYELDRSKYP